MHALWTHAERVAAGHTLGGALKHSSEDGGRDGGGIGGTSSYATWLNPSCAKHGHTRVGNRGGCATTCTPPGSIWNA